MKPHRFWLLSILVLLAACETPSSSEERIVDIDVSTMSIDGELPALDPAISADETRMLRDTFLWAETEELPEVDAEGRPTLWYALIYVESREDVQALREMDVHFSFVPLFEQERERWAGQTGRFTLEGDGEGLFAFAIIPGAFFNVMRDAAIAGTPPFRAIIIQDPPPMEARNADGSIHLEYLAEQGFVYGGNVDDIMAPSTRVGVSEEAITFHIQRELANAGEDAIDEARIALGELTRFWEGTRNLRVVLRVLNSDPGFDPTDVMRRAWGPTSGASPVLGEPLTLPGVEVQAHMGIAMFRGYTNQFGVARFPVSRGLMNVCVELSNHAGEITNFPTATVVCTFTGDGRIFGLNVTDDTTLVMNMLDSRVAMLAQMSDGYAWMQHVVGRPPRRAYVMTGVIADAIGDVNGGRAFAVCGGDYQAFDFFTEFALGPAGATDIVMPYDRSEGAISRGVMTHEYGHFVLCDLMFFENAYDFWENWINVVIETLGHAGAPAATDETLYVNEGWADFFASEVAGGTNYFPFAGSSITTSIAYCDDPATSLWRRGTGTGLLPCTEDNIGGATPLTAIGGFGRNIARVVSILHDVFDGDQRLGEADRYRPGRAGTFQLDTTTFRMGDPVELPIGTDDEPVALPGRGVLTLMNSWSRYNGTLNERALMNAIARAARTEGFSSTEVCELFQAHTTPGPDGALDCTDLADADAIGRRVLPSQPVIQYLTRATTTTGGHSVVVDWRDFSPFATGFAFEISGGSGIPISDTVGYARHVTRTESGLEPNTRYTLRIATRNGSLDSEPALREFLTFTDPVASVTATPGRGSITVSWTPPSSSFAGYEVRMVEPAARLLARTTDTSIELTGLSDALEFVFEVVTVNADGEPSEPRLSPRVRPMAPNALYVSPAGSDIGTGRGTPAAPFRTLGAAMSAAGGGGVDVIRMTEGAYSETPISVGVDIAIEGGYRASGGTWTPDGGVTEVRFTSVLAGSLPAVRTQTFNLGGLPSRAALVVESGTALALRSVDVKLEHATLPTGECFAPIYVAEGTLDVSDSSVVMRSWLAADSCAAGILGTAVSTTGSALTLTGASVVGAQNRGIASGVQVAGVALDGITRVTIADSTIDGVFDFTLATPEDVAVLAGVTTSDSASVSIERSDARAVGNPLEWRAGRGVLVGIDIHGRGDAWIDDTVVRIPSGGDEPRAIEIGSAATGTMSTVTLLHVTAVAGADPGLEGEVPVPFRGSAVRLTGRIDALRVMNSVLSFASGGVASPDMHWTGIDERDLEAPPAQLHVQGNVFSVPGFWRFGGIEDGSLVSCQPDPTHELGGIYSQETLNTASAYACGGASSGFSLWTARDNVALVDAPTAAAVGSTPDLTRPWAVGFSSTGYPTNARMELVGSYTRVIAAGRPLASLPVRIADVRDRGGVVRDEYRVQGAGAWILP